MQDSTDAVPSTIFFNPVARRFPVLVGDISSTIGDNPVFLRYQSLTANSVQLFLQEEQSFDDEMSHVLEDVSLFVAE